MIENENGLKVKELIKFLTEWQSKFDNEDAEVWINGADGLSNVAVRVCRLNESDVILGLRDDIVMVPRYEPNDSCY